MDALELILEEILNDFESANKNITNSNDMDINELNSSFNRLKKYDNKIKKINKILNIITNIQNNMKIIFSNSIIDISDNLNNGLISNEPLSIPAVNAVSAVHSVNIIKEVERVKYKNIIPTKSNSDIYKIPVIEITKMNKDKMINCPVYYITDENKYAIKINNNIIKGNIGNIISQTQKLDKIRKCSKLDCNGMFFKKKCNFIHKKEIKNFPQYSWSHINIGKNKSSFTKYDKENSRFLGSRDSIETDIVYSSKFEKKLRKSQLMHDILIYQILSNYIT